ncbi:helix-turn-helix domain-containing protein [Salinicola sp. JS01]|uniref:helix-turn-helix domain-containing protein n=1 Tax=Salinicola sp. JS01 TaxID=3050071 RepID=UPI00255B6C8A|nr:helix-turn-helix domain-containing protein [Salinicola sp. JS01]WIX33911.1 helix-turn-helix domain-containing protein [Salinicola sp. JS01]
MADGLLRPEQVAQKLGMSLSWVYGHKHEIGFIQFGSAVRFDQEEVEEYAQQCRRGPQHKEDRVWDSQFHNGKTEARGSCAPQSTVAVLSELFARKEKQDSMR